MVLISYIWGWILSWNVRYIYLIFGVGLRLIRYYGLIIRVEISFLLNLLLFFLNFLVRNKIIRSCNYKRCLLFNQFFLFYFLLFNDFSDFRNSKLNLWLCRMILSYWRLQSFLCFFDLFEFFVQKLFLLHSRWLFNQLLFLTQVFSRRS